MYNKNIIIGGGITGIASALRLISDDNPVTIYEISNSIGGVLKDYKNDNGTYFNSCQYMNSENNFLQNIFHNLRKEFIEFEHTYSSFTDLFDEETICNNFAGITMNFEKELKLSQNNNNSLDGRLRSYPSEISFKLINWVKRFGIDPEQITYDGAIGLQVSRIYIKNRVDEILEKKNLSVDYDNLYGLPRSLQGLKKIKAMLPKNGYDELFKKITLLTSKAGVKIIYNAPIIPSWINKSTLLIKNRGEELQSNRVIWTCNPTALIKFYDNKKIDSVAIKMRVFVADLNGFIDNPHYIQVYSKTMNIVRIFVYKINEVSKITIECFNEEYSTNEIISNSEKLLKLNNFDLKIDKESLDSFSQKRYFLTTINDQKIFDEFYSSTKESNLINGQWNIYGRDQKIMNIFDQLDVINE